MLAFFLNIVRFLTNYIIQIITKLPPRKIVTVHFPIKSRWHIWPRYKKLSRIGALCQDPDHSVRAAIWLLPIEYMHERGICNIELLIKIV